MSQPTYESVYRASVDDPERFWLDAADAVEWITPPCLLYTSDAADDTASV